MKRFLVGVSSLALLWLGVEGVSAFGHGHKTCAPAPSCAPAVQYTTQTVYQDVQRTVCETVPVTTTVAVTECYTEPMVSKQKETYYETVQKPMKGKHTVYKCVTEKQ